MLQTTSIQFSKMNRIHVILICLFFLFCIRFVASGSDRFVIVTFERTTNRHTHGRIHPRYYQFYWVVPMDSLKVIPEDYSISQSMYRLLTGDNVVADIESTVPFHPSCTSLSGSTYVKRKHHVKEEILQMIDKHKRFCCSFLVRYKQSHTRFKVKVSYVPVTGNIRNYTDYSGDTVFYCQQDDIRYDPSFYEDGSMKEYFDNASYARVHYGTYSNGY